MTLITKGVSEFKCSDWTTQDLENFVKIDYWDTLEYLVTHTWLNLEKEKKKGLTRKTFNENTRIAIWSLNATFLGAIREYETRLEKSEKNIKTIASIFQVYLNNQQEMKNKGRKGVKKWKV